MRIRTDMVYKYTFLLSSFFLLGSFLLPAQKTLDGTEIRTSKKHITVEPQGQELPFRRSEVYRFMLDPHFHEHEGMYIMDTVVVITGSWFRQYSGLEAGLHSMQLKGKNIPRLSQFSVSIGDPMSPSDASDTLGIHISLSYKGPGRFKKPFPLAIHVNGSDAQSMAWGYIAAPVSLPMLSDSCIQEILPAEVGEFSSGFIQEIHLLRTMPAKLRINFYDSRRTMCIESFSKQGIEKASWEIRNIVLRFP